MERIRFADDIPICFEIAVFRKKSSTDTAKQKLRSHCTEHSKKEETKIGAAKQTISAVLASEKIAEYLEVKRGDAVLRLRQISYFEDGTPFEYVRTQYVGDRFEFYLER